MNEVLKRTVLVVGDDETLITGVQPVIERAGFTMVLQSPDSKPEQVQQLQPAVALVCCDEELANVRRMLDEDYLDAATEVLLVGRAEQHSLLEQWLSQGRAFFLGRPLNLDYLAQLLQDIHAELEKFAESGEQQADPGTPMDRFGLLLGSSSPMRRIFRQLRKVSATDISVMVCGESGTGKELVAETIHMTSARNEGPFLAINCGAIPADLVESELFGHEKGSFSGAQRRHLGVFERADGGTLFLDEITEMPTDVQVKLLRVLETGKLRTVGGEQDTSINVRIVSATNRTPEQAIASGRLREDLYFRLASFVVRLPPLRERGRDAIGLAQMFLTGLNSENNTSCSLSADALTAIAERTWAGNVRELKSAIERAYLVGGELIESGDLPESSLGDHETADSDSLQVSIGSSLEVVERRLIFATLDAVGGSKPEAAEALGISLKTLYNRLNRYEGDDSSVEGSKF